MILNLIWPIEAQSILRLPLNELITEICRLIGPVIGHVTLLDLNLFGQYLIPDFLPVLSIVWPSAIHALIDDNAHGVVVHGDPMIGPAHNLRRHIPRGS